MPLLIRETDDFVLDAGTVPGPHPFDFAAVERRAVEVVQNHPLGFRVGPGDVAIGEIVQRAVRFKGEGNYRVLPRLALQPGKIDAGTEHPGGGAGLEAPQLNAQRRQGAAEIVGGEHAPSGPP